MTSHRLAAAVVAAAFIVAGSLSGAGAPQERKAVPREGSEQRQPPDTNEPRRAVPRPPAAESKPFLLKMIFTAVGPRPGCAGPPLHSLASRARRASGSS